MKNIFFFVCLLFFVSGYAQPAIEWTTCLTSGASNAPHSIVRTPDGGYLTTNSIYAAGVDVVGSGFHGGYDIWVTKLNDKGALEWHKCYGGTRDDRPSQLSLGGGGLITTTDGNYVFVGHSNSTDGDLLTNKGGFDLWVVKIDGLGNILWKKSFGGSGDEKDFRIQETQDGGFVIAGETLSANSGDVSGYHGLTDSWVIKLDKFGNKEWQRCLGSSLEEKAGNVIATSDGGYLMAISTEGNNGDVSGHHGVLQQDCWLVKMDTDGDIEWQRCIGGSQEDLVFSVIEVADGYMMGGSTFSTDGDVKSAHHGDSDIWVVKVEKDGDVVWDKTYGGQFGDYAIKMIMTADNGFLLAGMTESYGSASGDVKHPYYYFDGWLIKINNVGNLEWEKCVGGTMDDWLLDVQENPDGSIVCVAESYSNDGEAKDNSYLAGILTIKLEAGSTLPVHFAQFAALKKREDVWLSWTTVVEPAAGQFWVQRSTDGRIFNTIGVMQGGNGLRYSYIDKNVLKGTVKFFYRIVAEDENKARTQTMMIHVTHEKSGRLMELVGNPVKEQVILQCQSSVAGNYQLTIVDAKGGVLFAKEMSVPRGSASLRLPVSFLRPGAYVLHINNGGLQQSIKFIKQ